MKQLIQLSKVITQGVVLEDILEENDSTFNAIYQKTGILIQNIVQQQLESRRSQEQYKKEEAPNLIAFEGRRGTGKTSVMLSVCNALNQYQDRRKNNDFLKFEQPVSFTVLDYIDASLLGKTDDFMEQVLANMYTKFLECTDRIQNDVDYERRKIQQLFDDVYGRFLANRQEKTTSEISPIRALTKLSSSRTLEKKTKELIKEYLEYMNQRDMGYGRNSNFLIIPVDDLDMYFPERGKKSPYDILEKIHRYLMIPGVIVLLTYNYTDLCRGCSSHFRSMFEKPDLYSEIEIQNLTTQYLNKVIPIWARIHMLSLSKKDYRSILDTKVSFTYDEAKEVFHEFTDILWKEMEDKRPAEISLKRLSFILQADTEGLYYDALGNKKHFIEASTLRELSQRYSFKMQLKAIREHNSDGYSKENLDEMRKRVLKELLDDLYFRFALEKMPSNEFKQFVKHLQVGIERRSRDIIKEIRNKHGEISEIAYLVSREHTVSYSYGELLFSLYKASSEEWYSKEFISSVLNSYTIMLTNIYQQMIYNKEVENYQEIKVIGEENEKFENRELMKKILGASIASSWSNRLFPRVNFNLDSDGAGETSRNNLYQVDATVSEREKNIAYIGAKKIQTVSLQWEYNLAEAFDEEVIEKELQTLEILCMFFTNVSYRADKEDFLEKDGFFIEYVEDTLKLKLEHLQSGKESIGHIPVSDTVKHANSLMLRFTDACFNIMNFVNNAFDYKNFFGKLHRDLKEAYGEYLKKINCGDMNVDQFIEAHSLKNQFDVWFDKSQGFAMPVYSFDMMYNIFKRVSLYEADSVIAVKPKNWGIYMCETYGKIGDMLKKEDEFYFANLNNETKNYKFRDNYLECPFVDFILKEKQFLINRDNDKDGSVLEGTFWDHFIKLVYLIGQVM